VLPTGSMFPVMRQMTRRREVTSGKNLRRGPRRGPSRLLPRAKKERKRARIRNGRWGRRREGGGEGGLLHRRRSPRILVLLIRLAAARRPHPASPLIYHRRACFTFSPVYPKCAASPRLPTRPPPSGPRSRAPQLALLISRGPFFPRAQSSPDPAESRTGKRPAEKKRTSLEFPDRQKGRPILILSWRGAGACASVSRDVSANLVSVRHGFGTC